jgi:hypothetical protein
MDNIHDSQIRYVFRLKIWTEIKNYIYICFSITNFSVKNKKMYLFV